MLILNKASLLMPSACGQLHDSAWCASHHLIPSCFSSSFPWSKLISMDKAQAMHFVPDAVL